MSELPIPEVTFFLKTELCEGWRLAPKICDYHTVNYVVGGRVIYVVDRVPHELSEGDVLFIQKGSLKEGILPVGDTVTYYSFHLLLQDRNGRELSLPFQGRFHLGIDPELVEYCERFEEHRLDPQEPAELKSRGLFSVILSILLSRIDESGGVTKHSVLVDSVRKYLLAHYREDVTVKQLARHLGMNAVYLGNRFRELTGLSIKQYLNTIRVRKARDLLVSGGYSVACVSAAVGFQDPYYFSRVFRSIEGFPPSKLIH